MKIKILLILGVFLLPLLKGQAQHTDTFSCAFDTILHREIQANPRLKNAITAHLHGAQRFREKNPNLILPPKPMPAPPCDMCMMSIDPGCFKTKYILPVIYHIVHYASDSVPGTGSNVSDVLVQSSVNTLNKRFAGYGLTDTMAANTGIQFYLAPVGPDSNGIIRYPSPMSNHSALDRLSLLNLIDSQYRYGSYINIFVVDQIHDPKVAGYATNPKTTGIFFQMITVIARQMSDYSDCSNCGLDTGSRGKLMSHEMGHYLGLMHTFAGNCAGTDSSDCATKGDGCCDTPPVNFGNLSCPDSFFNSCHETPVDLLDQVENDMDYAPETCAKWLTRNQAEIMHYTLETYRRDLIDPELLFQFNPDICFFSAYFKTLNNIVCDTGGTVTLKAIPYGTTGVDYRWTILDSAQAVVFDTTLTDLSIFNYHFSIKGYYDVRLQLIYGGDTATEYKSKAIWVLSCEGAIAHEGGNWFFGHRAGLVFAESGVRLSLEATSPPLFPDNPTISTSEGGISLSDSMGNLMFYGGGQSYSASQGRVFSKEHREINDRYNQPLLISGTAAQNSIAFPCPFDPEKMMVVQNNAGGYGTLTYTLLKKDGNGLYVLDTATLNTPVSLAGFGDTLRIGEYLTAAPKCNAKGYWLAVVVPTNNDSLDYLTIISVDTNGFVLADSILFYKAVYSNLTNNKIGFSGQAKFSPDATKLVCNKYIFDFDRVDGSIKLKFTIPVFDLKPSFNPFKDPDYSIYGIAFSPNSRFLYWIAQDSINKNSYVYRINLSRSNPFYTMQNLGISPDNYPGNSMQLGPDNAIYISNSGSDEIGVIKYPDKDWANEVNPFGYFPYGVPLSIDGQGGVSTFGLPNFVDALRPNLVKDTIYYTIKDCNTVEFSTTACCYANYKWLFGDGDTSIQKQAEHLYEQYGEYEAMLVLNHVDTLKVSFTLHEPVVSISGYDTICAPEYGLVYQAIGEFNEGAEYTWSLDSGIAISSPSVANEALVEVHSIPAKITVQVYDDKSGCYASDSMMISVSYGITDNIINNGENLFAFGNLDSSDFSMEGSTPAGGDGTFVYEWEASHDSLTFFPLTGQEIENLIAHSTDTTLFVRRWVFSNKCESPSNIVKVYLALAGNTIGDTLHFCYTDSFLTTGSIPVGGIGDYQYQWYISDDDSTWYAIEDETNKDLYHIGYTESRYFKRRVVSGSDTIESNTLLGIPKINDNNIINNGEDTLIIYDYLSDGSLIIAGNTPTGTGSPSYQWYYSADSADWHEVTGQDQMDLEHDTFSGYRWFYRTASIDDCELQSNIVKVYPKVWNNVIGDTVYLCFGDSVFITGSTPVGGANDYQYQWFASHNGIDWTVIEGETEKDYHNVPSFSYLKRRVYSGYDSTESNSTQLIPTLASNSISSVYGGSITYFCPGSDNQFINPGSSPFTPLESPNYQWYYAPDSLNFVPISGQTDKDLNMPAGDTTLFIYREVSVTGCASTSNIIKAVPHFEKQEIYADVCYDGTGDLSLSGNFSPFYNQNYPTHGFVIVHVNWQALTGGFTTFSADTIYSFSDSTKAKSAVYTGVIDTFLSFRRLFQTNTGSCIYTSDPITIYNPTYLNQIEINNGKIAGKTEIPSQYFDVVWEAQCTESGLWEVITDPESSDMLGDSTNYACCDIRRKLIPLDANHEPADCDTFISNIIGLGGPGAITQQPVVQLTRSGNTVSFSVSYDSDIPFDIQWQEYNTDTDNWDDLEGETNTDLIVQTDKCNNEDLFRAVITNECRTVITNSVTLDIAYNDMDFFLWLKDLPSDTAQEPHHPLVNGTASHFVSPDIAASNSTITTSSWGISTTFLNGTLDLYTKVRNKGTDTSSGGKLFLYASLNGLNPEWDFHFTDEIRGVMLDSVTALWNFTQNLNPPYQNVTFGTPINTQGIEIPPIPPGDSVILYYHWTNPPDHFIEHSLVHRGNTLLPSPRSLLYLARIEECEEAPHGMTYHEEFFDPVTHRGTARANIEKNARIAALHSHRLPTRAHIMTLPPYERIPSLITELVSGDLIAPIKVDVDFSSAPQYFIVGNMFVYFDDVLWNAFAEGGYNGSGYAIVEEGVFRITSLGNVFWNNIMLDTDSVGRMGFAFHYKSTLDTTGESFESMFRVVMSQAGTETGELLLHTESHFPSSLMMTAPKEDEREYDQADKRHNDQTADNQLSVINNQSAAPSLIFTASPNPFGNELTVFAANHEPEATITLRDMNGKELYRFALPKEPTPSGHSVTIPTHNLAEAVYFVHYQSNTTHAVRKAVLVR